MVSSLVSLATDTSGHSYSNRNGSHVLTWDNVHWTLELDVVHVGSKDAYLFFLSTLVANRSLMQIYRWKRWRQLRPSRHLQVIYLHRLLWLLSIPMGSSIIATINLNLTNHSLQFSNLKSHLLKETKKQLMVKWMMKWIHLNTMIHSHLPNWSMFDDHLWTNWSWLAKRFGLVASVSHVLLKTVESAFTVWIVPSSADHSSRNNDVSKDDASWRSRTKLILCYVNHNLSSPFLDFHNLLAITFTRLFTLTNFTYQPFSSKYFHLKSWIFIRNIFFRNHEFSSKYFHRNIFIKILSLEIMSFHPF